MVLTRPGAGALEAQARDTDRAAGRCWSASAPGRCRTDLHVVEELPEPEIPIVPGHEIVGVVEGLGDSVTDLAVGDRVGIPWLGYSCDECEYCKSDRENLCVNARFTGYHIDGGYADYTVADARFVFKLPDGYTDAEAAPLLCAGLIGYRVPGGRGRTPVGHGFGAAAHILVQVAAHEGREASVFTRPGDEGRQSSHAVSARCGQAGPARRSRAARRGHHLRARRISRSRGAEPCRAGRVVVCAGIHMSDIPVPARLLWEERVVRSVANVTRKDAPSSSRWRRSWPSRRTCSSTIWRTPIARSPISAKDDFKARRSSRYDHAGTRCRHPS
jgi:propanol-preferring alcohol dehydrogenase